MPSLWRGQVSHGHSQQSGSRGGRAGPTTAACTHPPFADGSDSLTDGPLPPTLRPGLLAAAPRLSQSDRCRGRQLRRGADLQQQHEQPSSASRAGAAAGR